MKHQIEAPLANGEMVIVEVDGAETSARPIIPPRGVREFVEEQVVERVGQTFEAALGKVGPAAATIMVRIRVVKEGYQPYTEDVVLGKTPPRIKLTRKR